MKFFCYIALALSPLSAFHASAQSQLVHDDDLLNAKVYQLENGLTVYLTENNLSPRFYAEIAVRCGSYHDPADATGLAHYLEHLMFKGSKKIGTTNFEEESKVLSKITELFEQHKAEDDAQKRKEIYAKINATSQEAAKFAIANEMDKLYKSLGGSNINAHTSFDETVYKVNLPSNRLRQWAMIESERFSNPIFRLFHTELETVYEEKNRSNDKGNNLVFNAAMKGLYPDHRYGNTILGAEEHLKNPSISQLYSHYAKYYVPENMAIIISGDIDTQTTLKVIEDAFGKLAPSATPLAPIEEKLASAPSEIKHIELPFQGEESVSMAFKTVPNGHEDMPALQMLDMLLDNSVVGLLEVNLIQGKKVRNAGSWPLFLNQGGSQHFYVYPRAGQSLDELEGLILSQIELLKKGEFEESMLEPIRFDLLKSDELSFETNAGRVAALRDSFLELQPWSEAVQKHARFASVTKEDIVRVAKKYFNHPYVTVHRVKGDPVISQIDKPQIDPIEMNPVDQSPYSDELTSLEVNAIAPVFIEENAQYIKSTLANGMEFITTKNPINNIFNLTWHFPVGTFTVKELSTAISVLESSGTDKLSPIELKNLWYKLGSSASFNTQERSTSVTLTGPEHSYDESVKLFYEWVKHFSFDQSTLQKIIEDTKQSKADSRSNPNSIVHAMARFRRYGDQSVYRLALSDADLDKLTEVDMKRTIDSLFTTPHTIAYTGKKSAAIWQDSLTIASDLTKAKEETPRAITEVTDPVSIYFLHREMSQAQVWIESIPGEWDESDRAEATLFNGYFSGGMSSIVFQELREARGLAYSANAFISTPRRKNGSFVTVGTIGCQADKAVEAINTFNELFEQIPDNQERFDRSKSSLVQKADANRIPFRSIASTLMAWKRMGVEGNMNKISLEQIQGTSLEDVQKFHTDHIKGKPKRISIVGDRNKVDLDALRKLGTLKEVTAEDIFTL